MNNHCPVVNPPFVRQGLCHDCHSLVWDGEEDDIGFADVRCKRLPAHDGHPRQRLILLACLAVRDASVRREHRVTQRREREGERSSHAAGAEYDKLQTVHTSEWNCHLRFASRNRYLVVRNHACGMLQNVANRSLQKCPASCALDVHPSAFKCTATL